MAAYGEIAMSAVTRPGAVADTRFACGLSSGAARSGGGSVPEAEGYRERGMSQSLTGSRLRRTRVGAKPSFAKGSSDSLVGCPELIGCG
jgi:hypothetical protein